MSMPSTRKCVFALMVKESRQLGRDRATLGMLLGIPLLQIALFGGAIELAPHRLDIRIIASDTCAYTRIERVIAATGASVRLSRSSSGAASGRNASAYALFANRARPGFAGRR